MTLRIFFFGAVCFWLACGGTGSVVGDSGNPGGDAGEADLAPAATCGDGVVQVGEVCDGAARACGELGGSWGGGMAGCRKDCRGWDPSACTLTDATRMEVVKPATRDPQRWATARCNDGTPFDFFIRPQPKSDTWVIYLQGGVFCDDSSLMCDVRDNYYVTTIPPADRMLVVPGGAGGVLSVDPLVNPDFSTANLVLAHYCSSDFWTGDTTERRPSTADPAKGWYYSGHANVDALFATLVQRYGLDDSRAELRVLFGGGSAGAHGAHFNNARARAVLPKTTAAGRLKLLADAGWMFEFDDPQHRIGAATTTDREVWRNALSFWGGNLDPACVAAVTDPIDCWFGVGWYPHVSKVLPILLQQTPDDPSFGNFLHGFTAQSTAQASWKAQASMTMKDVPWLFSGSAPRPYHTRANDDVAFQIGPAGSTLQQVLGRFWAGGAPERVLF